LYTFTRTLQHEIKTSTACFTVMLGQSEGNLSALSGFYEDAV